MSQTKAKPVKPLAVLDFRCDGCKQKMDAVVIVHSRVIKHIAASYHDECWTKQKAAQLKGAN